MTGLVPARWDPILNREASVQVLRSTDCAVLTGFPPPLDITWLIRFTSQTDATFSDVTDGAFGLGPALAEMNPAPCPWP